MTAAPRILSLYPRGLGRSDPEVLEGEQLVVIGEEDDAGLVESVDELVQLRLEAFEEVLGGVLVLVPRDQVVRAVDDVVRDELVADATQHMNLGMSVDLEDPTVLGRVGRLFLPACAPGQEAALQGAVVPLVEAVEAADQPECAKQFHLNLLSGAGSHGGIAKSKSQA
jgi:hypothetical protein